MTRPSSPIDIMTAERIMAMPAGPDKAEVMAFARFLKHHGPPHKPGDAPGSRICTCGVGARLEGDKVRAVPNPDCDCPCHQPGYALHE